ncbi:MAG TPA: hypothetical protein PLW26_00785 [Candidatus Mcinerneyibacteriales bacterium]|nr:hypothetical protein [Candidatus Mcinerneyibacteriales bacterium]
MNGFAGFPSRSMAKSSGGWPESLIPQMTPGKQADKAIPEISVSCETRIESKQSG